MLPAYPEIRRFVEALAPTWRKTQVENFAQLINAVIDRPSLNLANLARALPRPDQPLHGRLKRLLRFLDNSRLDELALSARYLKLSYRFSADLPGQAAGPWLFPVLLDTTYYEPFAALVATVPCGSRGLPIALTTYHRTQLVACFPPASAWPDPTLEQPGRRRGEPFPRAAAQVRPFASQNAIEAHLITLVWHLLSPAVRGVLVADRGFARASLFGWLLAHPCDFVIRLDAMSHVAFGPGRPSQAVGAALALRPGERRWCPDVAYHQTARIPVNLLGIWDNDQKEPWYLATTLDRPDWTETCYRWRMRLEAANRDEKIGVLLREGGDAHRLRKLVHVHRLLLVLAAAEWLSALVGLEALHDLAPPAPPPEAARPGTPGSAASPSLEPAPPPEPALPPPVLPHRGRPPKVSPGLRRFVAWGALSYVRLGLEVIRAPDLGWIVQRLVRWLDDHLRIWAPLWRPWQRRYRLKRRWRSAA